ncbi:MAG: hypothetical protein H7Y18_10035 [Clostridiaceae bacterium]|nr:hypothetical protein [Clostridiaceae bacterium]
MYAYDLYPNINLHINEEKGEYKNKVTKEILKHIEVIYKEKKLMLLNIMNLVL